MSAITRFRNGKTGHRKLNALVTELSVLFRKAPATTVAIANTGTPDGVAHVTGQVQDAEGNSLAGRFMVAVYLDDAAYGAPADLGTLTAKTNSLLLQELTDDALALVRTHSDGSWGVDLDTAADGTVHAHALVVGTFATASVAVTGNP
jgi:hypothetical protein